MEQRPHPTHPYVVILAGPNGAGKTTISRAVLADTLGLTTFVNADTVAQGLSGFDPERAAFQAGRVMLTRLRELAAARADFAFETTLASRTFAPWLAALRGGGYQVHLVYMFLRSPSLAVRRVRARVRQGGPLCTARNRRTPILSKPRQPAHSLSPYRRHMAHLR